MSKRDDEIKSALIHGKPPNEGRWVKGQSGNRRGRPKKRKVLSGHDTTAREQFLKAAEKLITVMENGHEVRIPLRDAVMRSEAVAALKGSSHAQRNYIARYERYRDARMLEIAENHQKWREYINAYEAVEKQFNDRKQPLPDYYPHPDELQFKETEFVTGWRGGEPIQASIMRGHYIQMRDLLLLHSEKDRRHQRSKDGLDHLSGAAALLYDAFLPEHVQFNASTLAMRIWQQRGLQKRELYRRLTAAWTEIGRPKGTDVVFPQLPAEAWAKWVSAKLHVSEARHDLFREQLG